MLKQIGTSTQEQVNMNEVTFERSMHDGITLTTLCDANGNVEIGTTNLTDLWKAVLASPDFV